MREYLKIAENELLSIFEQHFYVMADPFPEENFDGEVSGELLPIVGAYLKVKMDFSGDLKGHFILLFPEDKAKEIMGNILGVDGSDPSLNSLSGADAAAEILNIIGANILSRQIGEIGSYNIGLPETTLFSNEKQKEFLKEKNITGILIDEKAVFLQMAITK